VARAAAGAAQQITQTVRIGLKQWQTAVTGTFRDVNYLATGLSADRVPEDDILVSVHFTKDNGEQSGVTLDEHSKIELVEAQAPP
jgi:hypothetical protein